MEKTTKDLTANAMAQKHANQRPRRLSDAALAAWTLGVCTFLGAATLFIAVELPDSVVAADELMAETGVVAAQN